MGTFERTVECDGRQYEIYRDHDEDDSGEVEYVLVDACGSEIARFDAPPDDPAVVAALRAIRGNYSS